MSKYDLNKLQEIVERDGCKLTQEYEKVNGETKIHFICGNVDCTSVGSKYLYRMSLSGGFCRKCTLRNALEVRKETCKKLFGVENCFQSEAKKEKIVATCLAKYGETSAAKSEEVKSKMKRTNLERYGCEHARQNDEIKLKIQNTMQERYGVSHGMYSEAIRNKIKDTNRTKYGVENTFQVKEFQEKSKQTCLERFGTEYASQSDDFKAKVRETNLQKFGTECVLQSHEVKQKICETNTERYGYPYTSQCPELFEKRMKAAYMYKEYMFPCGEIRHIQGYENFALDELVRLGYTSNDIVTGAKEVPGIFYEKDGKSHRYYCDIYIIKENWIIEVKSTWTIQQSKSNVNEKAQACVKAGYKYEIWVFNNKGEKEVLKY